MSKKRKPSKQPDCRWTIADLEARVEQALAVDYPGAASGRIRSIPNERTLRYYTTIGLLDRPVEMRGRTGLYGWRHLLQVVAIKRLQAQGLNLVDIQQRLTGRANAALAAMARLPERPTPADLDWSPSKPPAENEPAQSVTPGRRQRPFWRRQAGNSIRRSQSMPAAGLQSFQLDRDVMLVFVGDNAGDADLAALRRAAQPLLNELARRGLLHDPRETGELQ